MTIWPKSRVRGFTLIEMVVVISLILVHVVEGPVAKRLIQGGWATFLIKVQNDAGITPQLKPDEAVA